MIVFQSWLITIEFDPRHDVLSAELPNVAEFGMTELSKAMDLVAEHVINYDAAYLLMDSSRVMVEKLDYEEYKKLIWKFLVTLSTTRLKKFARLNTSAQSFDERAITIVREVFQLHGASIEVMPFSSKEEAHVWLCSLNQTLKNLV